MLCSKRILVIGDLMLDRYTHGSVSRVSPEAPVCVLKAEREESRPGGAGNAILNLLALGQEIVVVGRIGADREGEIVSEGLRSAGADLSGLFIQENYETPLKHRFIAGNHQMLRVDREQIVPSETLPPLTDLIKGVHAIAISDYGKGLLTPSFLADIIATAQYHGIPVVVDPKGVDFSRYKGATLIKPNEYEAALAANLSDPSLDAIGSTLLAQTKARHLMITRGEAGISLFAPDTPRKDFPTHIRSVRDVTGAGDTVLATCTAALANSLPIHDTIALANQAAGIAVGRFGCVPVALSDLAKV